jgi:hypothetical protein
MHLGDERIRHGGQDRAGFEHIVVRIAPAIPESRESKYTAGREAEVVGLFLFGPGFLPFEKAVRRNETAVPFERIAEGGFLGWFPTPRLWFSRQTIDLLPSRG